MGRDPGASPGAANTDALRSLRLYCLLGYKRIRRQKHDSETGERIRASQGICERLSLYLRRQNADINCPCHFWSIVRHVQCLSPRREDHLSQCPGECHECHEPPHEAHFQNILTPRLLLEKKLLKVGAASISRLLFVVC